MKFEIKDGDYGKSPYTGMTRKHWLEACEFLLDGIFSNLSSMADQPVSPRTEFDVSYPNPGSSPTKASAAKFEGLARSFLIAAPLLHNRPEAVIRSFPVREYYKQQILQAMTPGSPNYLLNLKELLAIARPGEKAFQHTCECASLVIGLDQCREAIWDTYTKEEKDLIAAYLSEFACGKTTPHNWRLFNMLILGFLHKEGYEIDRELMRDHAQVIISYYTGDGWYRDGHRFDYYTPWAFHVYGPIWNVWYGYEEEPWIANKIEQYANEMADVFSSMFDKEAKVTLWARSGLYRNAASSPYASAFLLRQTQVSPGLARRINSGALLQFITREDVFENGVPTLGFYGQFLPMLQDYSCSSSPFWIANPFLILTYPEDHPFWSDAEENGDWDRLKENEFKETVMDGPGIVSAHQGGNGACEFRTAKGLFKPDDEYIRYYIRLAFNSHFPWEDLDYQGAEAMQYSLLYHGEKNAQVPNIIMYGGVKDGVLYRKQYFDFQYNFQGRASIDLADFSVANGHIRVDKMRIPEPPFTLTMGAYGFPKERDGKETVIEERTCQNAKAVIMRQKGLQQAFVTYTAWEEIGVKERTGVNPDADISLLAYGSLRREKTYGYEPYVMICAVLSKSDGSPWTDEELFPIETIEFTDKEQYGGYGPVTLAMKDGRTMTVDYEGLEGRLMV
ncbi:MAG: DUF2264 domain-containing protein [Lacrimispora sp.]|uniref:DUF2264 domain-containing protein n=1 Tax=Lacrimispora sp. TaxID=2719234 RepID=UPI0039E533DD